MGVEGGDVDRVGGGSDERAERLGKEAAVQRIRAVLDEVQGGQAVGTKMREVRQVGMPRQGADLEGEGGGQRRAAPLDEGEQEVVGLHGIA